MNKSHLSKLGTVALAYGSIFAMSAADAPIETAREAAKQADQVVKALARHDAAAAVAAAEQAVQAAPGDAGYRLLLGQSYMEAGRFVSAGQAFADTLTLDSDNGKAALNLALTQIAAGDWQTARRTLGAHTGSIPAADRGLAMALAGDTDGAVAVLTAVARSPEATVKVRQNLALAYALAGQWQAARVVAAADLSPADVDKRLEQWAAFAQPSAASDQVASLLGVRPVSDNGQPVAVALHARATPVAMTPVEASVATQVVTTVAASVETAAAPQPAMTHVAFAAPHEVVQPLPATLIAPSPGPVKVALATRAATVRGPSNALAAVRPVAARSSSGQWYVQLGAYESAGVARDDWGRARRRYAAFSGHVPQGATIKLGASSFYRLSVGGFARADALRACQAYRARGGHCFVRLGAGEQVAQWVQSSGTRVAARVKPKGTQVAMR